MSENFVKNITSNGEINPTYQPDEKESEKSTTTSNTSKSDEKDSTTTESTFQKSSITDNSSNTVQKSRTGSIIQITSERALHDNTSPEKTLSETKSEVSEPKISLSYLQKHYPKAAKILYKYRGIIFAVLTAILMSLATYFVKKVQRDKDYSPYLTTFWRFLGILISSFPMIAYYQFYKGIHIFRTICPCSKGDRFKTLCFLIIRCLVGTSSFTFQYLALQTIQLADVSVIVFSSTVFVTFFAWCCLGEECGIVPSVVAFLTVIGVAIIAQPPFITGKSTMNGNEIDGFMYALSAMLTSAIAFILIRFLREIHFSLMALAFGSFGLVAGFVLTMLMDKKFFFPKNEIDTACFLAIAVFSSLGQICLTLALKYEDAGPVSVIRASDALFSFVWQTFDEEYPNEWSVVGATIVLSCVFITGFRKWLFNLKPEDPWKIKLWFLLK